MSGPIQHADVPWLDPDEGRAKGLILYGAQGEAEKRKRLRLELMRWHPDKFVGKFGARMLPTEKDRITEGVKRVSQLLNSLNNQKVRS